MRLALAIVPLNWLKPLSLADCDVCKRWVLVTMLVAASELDKPGICLQYSCVLTAEFGDGGLEESLL